MFASLPEPKREFEIARVLEDTVSITVRQSWPLILIAALLNAPQVAYGFVAATAPSNLSTQLGFLSVLFVSTLLLLVTQGMAAHLGVTGAENRRGEVRQSIVTGARRAFQVIAVNLLLGLAITIGLVLLIVPGWAAWIVWFVVTPAVVVERLGPLRAFRRSAELTRGLFWRVSGVAVLILLASLIISIGLNVVGLVLQGVSENIQIAAAVVTVVGGAISTTFGGVAAGACFAELRRVKGGGASEQTAEVFA